ncbi:cobalt-precorrin 5A hydrolase [Lachnospiraceae bacterium NSJ-143]|nr:cobalt-precorrin 5A hydrolase [Lachnospiraceae bacterium NSJ-143]
MNRVAVVSFTDKGSFLNRKLGRNLMRAGYTCMCAAPEKYSAKYGIDTLSHDYIKWIGGIFTKYDILLFIGAAGIAVRGIAPYIKDKFSDPAVVVLDENETYVIPILSGHIGGANAFAELVSELTGAAAVITTATDINNKFAVDIFAVKNNLKIIQRCMIRRISSAVLSNEKVSVYCDKPLNGKLPAGIVKSGKGKTGFSISVYKNAAEFENTLNLVPAKIHIGIGCRKGVSEGAVEEAINNFLDSADVFEEAVCCVSTINIKYGERGIIDCCSKKGWPITYYSADNLSRAKGEFASSDFVKTVTGIDNVCERAAVLSSNGGRLILGKTKYNGVTLAAACEEWSVDFG